MLLSELKIVAVSNIIQTWVLLWR